jgi:hypothetical protein
MGNDLFPNLNFSGSGINDTQLLICTKWDEAMYFEPVRKCTSGFLNLYAENCIHNKSAGESNGPEMAYRILRGGSWLTSQNTARL